MTAKGKTVLGVITSILSSPLRSPLPALAEAAGDWVLWFRETTFGQTASTVKAVEKWNSVSTSL